MIIMMHPVANVKALAERFLKVPVLNLSQCATMASDIPTIVKIISSSPLVYIAGTAIFIIK